MEQKKIGNFLKNLRKEKGITQEMLAEKLNVSGRTVSRWETGNNMPDISMLIELAEFYDISIPEIVNGERKNEKMNEEVKEVAQTLSAYADFEKENLIKKIQSQSIIGVIALMIYCILDFGGMPEKHTLLRYLSSYSLTLVFVTPIMILFYTTGVMEKTRKNRKISKFALIFVSCAIAIGVVFIIKAIVASFGL